MSEQPTPGVSEATAERRSEALTPDRIESVLSQFRAWLHDAAARSGTAKTPQPPAETIDLHTLVAQFTALRHEVNLQTRAVRAQQEQNTETLASLQQALESLRLATSTAAQPRDDSSRALLQTLIEIHDALALATGEAKRMRESVLPGLERMAAAEQDDRVDSTTSRPSFLARLFGGGEKSTQFRREWAAERQCMDDLRQSARQSRGILDSLTTGYTMSLQRIERALRQNELEPIPCVGELFDPERMEALEVVSGSGRSSGEVVDEVRRGYLWRGRVFRHAQVRVAKD
jgi:molecular chaperone GrpE